MPLQPARVEPMDQIARHNPVNQMVHGHRILIRSLLLLPQVRERCTLLLRLRVEVRVVHKHKLASQLVCGQVRMPIPLVVLIAVTPV